MSEHALEGFVQMTGYRNWGSALSVVAERLLNLAGVLHWDAQWVAGIWGGKQKELDWKPGGPWILSHPCPQLRMPPLAWLSLLRTLRQVLSSSRGKAQNYGGQISTYHEAGRKAFTLVLMLEMLFQKAAEKPVKDRRSAHLGAQKTVSF